MLKPQTLNIEETNIAGFGSDLEYKIKQASAEGEPTFKQFVGGVNANTSARTYMWRVHNFKLEEVSGDKTANFFRGDCYLALSVTGSKTAPVYTIFYWIGSDTSIDEAGTVSYKAFELDNVLTNRTAGTHAVQYREVCGDETELFRSAFPGMRVLDGGYDSGFHHVEKPQRKSRLLRVYTDHLLEVPFEWKSLCANGVFILDAGTKLYQWTGRTAPLRLKAPAMSAVSALDDERGVESQVIVLSENSQTDAGEFATLLGATSVTTTPEEVSGTGDLKFTGARHIETGRKEISRGMLRITKWDGRSFQYVGMRELATGDNIYIEDNGASCTVYGRLPLAALCVMAYFTWANVQPQSTTFAH